MAVHSCSRRHNRNPSIYTSRRSPKRPIHVRSSQASYRLRFHLSLSVSTNRPIPTQLETKIRERLIILSIIHISALHTALKSDDTTLASVEPTVWMQVELHYALVACSVFCIRPFMAAVSTNYGTAGDSTLESSASRTNTKEGSKSGSGSGSSRDPASRSRSRSRAHRKGAGTVTRPPVRKSGSGIKKFANLSLGNDAGVHAHEVLSKSHREDADAECEGRSPVCRSMFQLGTRKSFPNLEKGKHGSSSSVFPDSDLIELVTRPSTHHAGGSEGSTGDERMVIRKEVRYSIQYEDENPGRKEGLAHDVSVYV